MILLKPKPKPAKFLGLPETLGLIGESGELIAEWYARKQWALTASWEVIVSEPWSGGKWKIIQVVAFDTNGQIVNEYDCNIILCGPIKPQLTEKHIQFRKAHGLSLENDPFKGDAVTFTLEI